MLAHDRSQPYLIICTLKNVQSSNMRGEIKHSFGLHSFSLEFHKKTLLFMTGYKETNFCFEKKEVFFFRLKTET